MFVCNSINVKQKNANLPYRISEQTENGARLVSTSDPLIHVNSSMQILQGSFSTAPFKYCLISSIKTPSSETRHSQHSTILTAKHEAFWIYHSKLFCTQTFLGDRILQWTFRSIGYRLSSVHWYNIKHNPKITRSTTNYYINIIIHAFRDCGFDFYGILWLRKDKGCDSDVVCEGWITLIPDDWLKKRYC
jgi:hypothetical protein